MLGKHESSPTLDLFDRAPFPHDPGYAKNDTSYDAAMAIKPTKARLQSEVLAALPAHPLGLTSHELAEVTGRSYASIQPRTAELSSEEERQIEDSGDRRPTPSGRNSVVWRIKNA